MIKHVSFFFRCDTMRCDAMRLYRDCDKNPPLRPRFSSLTLTHCDSLTHDSGPLTHVKTQCAVFCHRVTPTCYPRLITPDFSLTFTCSPILALTYLPHSLTRPAGYSANCDAAARDGTTKLGSYWGTLSGGRFVLPSAGVRISWFPHSLTIKRPPCDHAAAP